jgi:hypothetical protein
MEIRSARILCGAVGRCALDFLGAVQALDSHCAARPTERSEVASVGAILGMVNGVTEQQTGPMKLRDSM